MTREEAKQLLPIIQAFAEGKTIQFRERDIEEPSFDGCPNEYRIKSEPKYRPFKTPEECWQEMLKHQPFGWVRSKKCKDLLWSVKSISNENIIIIHDYYKFISAFELFEFTDGTPFGIKEDN